MNTAPSTQPPLADGPLNGVRVIDLTRVLAGPYCTMVLADLGADVIKVENPNGGDDARAFGPFIGERSAYFASLNRGKQSIALNLKEEADKAVFHDLLAGADVLVENYRPGTMEKLGLGWEDLHTRYPKLIYAAASGFGHTGPYKTRAAYDMVVQAMGGIMSVTGYPGQPPVRVGSSIGDITAGLFTAVGVNAALLHRATSGQTMKIDVSMLDCQVAILENAIARYAATGEVAGPIGARHPAITPFAAFQAADGWIVIAAGNDSLFAKLCDAIGRPDLITDPRFATNGARTGNADALTVELNKALAAKPAADWLSTLDAVGVPSGPINKIDQVLNDVQVRARNMVVTAPDPDLGELLMAGNPIKLSPFTDPATRHPAPALDADRAAILSRVRASDEAPATGESAAEISPPVARMPAATTSAAVQATAAYLDQVGSFFSRLTDFRAALTSRNDSFEEKAIKLCDALLSERGEVLGTAVAVDLVTLIRAASQADRRQFIDLLADRYAPDQRALATAVDDYRLAPTASNLAALSEAVEAPRQQLFRRANTAPLGTRMLLDLRTEILAGKRDNPGWTPVDDDLRHLFGSWFNRGFLQLRRIDWNTPAAILEKLIDYEAVHTIAGWDDLRRRLASDRRCFAFFHPALPDEPLIFVEIALVNELSDSITPILTAPSPTEKGQGSAPESGRKIAANTAIFYSISNCQPGLRGIAFGNLLIKQVVSELAA
ncbi:MAG: CoA transferase, partial [Pseudomonadota bacterium]